MHNGYNNMNMGYGYQMNGLQMWPQNGMMSYNNLNRMNIQGGMDGYIQGMPNQRKWMRYINLTVGNRKVMVD